MTTSKIFWTVAVSLILLGHLGGFAIGTDEGEEAEAVDVDNGNATGIAICFKCNSTEECAVEQDAENSTVEECLEGQHCWTWKDEENQEVTYKRDCGDPCTEEFEELDCQTSNNRTQCKVCCSGDLCNKGLYNSANCRFDVFNKNFLMVALLIGQSLVVMLG